MHNSTISRVFVAYFIALTTVFICTLRHSGAGPSTAICRGIDTRNVLVVGASHMGNAVRKQITKYSHLGRVFKGFVETSNGS